MIKGKITDVSALVKKLNGAPSAIEKGVNTALKTATLEVHKEAVKGIREVSRGDVETRYGPKRTVAVSKEGDAPNSDTGRLIQSVMFEFEENKGFVGSNLGYAADLEFGTKKMAARPWLSIALMRSADKVAEIMRKSIDKSIQKALGVKGSIDKLSNIAKSSKKGVKQARKVMGLDKKKKRTKR